MNTESVFKMDVLLEFMEEYKRSPYIDMCGVVDSYPVYHNYIFKTKNKIYKELLEILEERHIKYKREKFGKKYNIKILEHWI